MIEVALSALYNRTVMSDIANDLEPQPRFHALLRIARVSPSESGVISEAQL
jgi:hypothetical protein